MSPELTRIKDAVSELKTAIVAANSTAEMQNSTRFEHICRIGKDLNELRIHTLRNTPSAEARDAYRFVTGSLDTSGQQADDVLDSILAYIRKRMYAAHDIEEFVHELLTCQLRNDTRETIKTSLAELDTAIKAIKTAFNEAEHAVYTSEMYNYEHNKMCKEE